MEARQVTHNKLSILFNENKSEFVLLIFITLIFVVSPLFSDVFLDIDNLMNLLRQSSFLVIVSIGMGLVILLGGIDLSIGAVMQLVGLCTILILGAGVPAWAALIIALLMGAGLGMINGVLTVFGRLQPFIATLATAAIMTGIVMTYTEGNSVTASGIDPAFKYIGGGYVGIVPIPAIVMMVIAVLFWWIMSKTTYGRYVYATGSNKMAAHNAGVRTKTIEISVYALSGTLAALSGFLYFARIASFQPSTAATGGSAVEIMAIAAVVIGGGRLAGGKGTVVGAVLGAMVSSILLNFLVLLDMGIWFQRFLLGLVIVVVVLFTSGSLNTGNLNIWKKIRKAGV